MTTPTLGLALIAKDEAENLPALLASIEGAFDQMAMVDTGSTDRTVDVFEEWAAEEKGRNPKFVSTLDHFEWIEDFAAARNAADDLLMTDWLCWADCDDVIVGARRLRQLLDDGSADAWAFPYQFQPSAPEEPEQFRFGFRERLRRRGTERWKGRLHEGLELLHSREGPDGIEWVHRRPTHREPSGDRNRSILRHWMEDEPRNLRPLAMLAWGELTEGRREAAFSLFAHYVALRHEHISTQVSYWERDTAEWALRELRFCCDHISHEEEFRDSCRPLVVLLLGRRPSAINGGSIFCREDEQNPEPGHHLTEFRTRQPRSRQQRRAEARARARELTAPVR